LYFPAARHDDIVDALGLVGQLLDRMADGRKPTPPKPVFDLKDPAWRPMAGTAFDMSYDDGSQYSVQSSVKLM